MVKIYLYKRRAIKIDNYIFRLINDSSFLILMKQKEDYKN